MSEFIIVALLAATPVAIIALVNFFFDRVIEPWLFRPSKKELKKNAHRLESDAAEAERLKRNLQLAQDEADRFIAAQRLKAMLRNDRHF